MDELIKDFGARVQQLRKSQQVSQEAFAQQAGIDRSYYGRIERGAANPTLRNIGSIAKCLGLSISELFDGIPAKESKRKRR